MKNKSVIILFLSILSLNFFYSVSSDEFNFDVTELQITESGNIIKGINGGIVTSKNNEIVKNTMFLICLYFRNILFFLLL